MWSTALSYLVDGFDPDVLVLTGELFEKSDRLFDLVKREVRARAFAGNGRSSLQIEQAPERRAEWGSCVTKLLWHDIYESANEKGTAWGHDVLSSWRR